MGFIDGMMMELGGVVGGAWMIEIVGGSWMITENGYERGLDSGGRSLDDSGRGLSLLLWIFLVIRD